MARKRITVQISDKAAVQLRNLAKQNYRSVSGQVEHLIERAAHDAWVGGTSPAVARDNGDGSGHDE